MSIQICTKRQKILSDTFAGQCCLQEEPDNRIVSNDVESLPAVRLAEQNANYEVDKFDAFDNEHLFPTSFAYTLDVSLKQLVTIGNGSLFLASLDASLHRRTSLDDCPDNASSVFQRHSTSAMRAKAPFGWNYYELSLRIGDLELVAVAGIHGRVDQIEVPFWVHPSPICQPP
ncbi:hypothetical protein VTP01DRAFT_6107 [Rhizomucor pusillus]|uniref:uncharacterized protein n=1 Tax=Rhizomucor pusillus TaxID=4840 RepID=UPI00374450C7